jgi:hypothetical protein
MQNSRSLSHTHTLSLFLSINRKVFHALQIHHIRIHFRYKPERIPFQLHLYNVDSLYPKRII